MPDPDWRNMDRTALDAAYNNSEAVPESPGIVEGWQQRSQKMRAGGGARLDIAYGERPREKFDYFPAQPGGPLFVFIHGGYWQMREKESFSIFAGGPRAKGFNVAIPGYTLAPDISLRGIVEEIRRALRFLASDADNLYFDPSRIFVGGWSAGGHLTAMMLDHPAVKGGLAISGIFDLEPIANCYLNEALKLDAADAKALSPCNHLGLGNAPLRLCVGGAELPELQRQSADYTVAAEKAGQSVQHQVLAGHNHFTILEELERPGSALTQELVALAENV